MRKRRNNVLQKLFQREYHASRCFIRDNLNIMKLLVCQGDGQFCKVVDYQSSTPISYECGHLFMDNYRTCLHVKSTDVPSLSYRLPPCSAEEKIEDCLISQSAPPSLLKDHHNWKASFLALTANNWLCRYDLKTGQQLQRIYLSNKFKFKHLEWDHDEHTIVLKSTHCKTPSHRISDGLSSPLVAIAMFRVWPLQFVGLFEVNKKVFGSDVSDALVNQGCLVVLHTGGCVRLYSIQHILAQGMSYEATLYEKQPGSTGNIVGMPPNGLPSNIALNVRPPLLFEVRCADHDISLGGVPWRYIVSPYKARGEFQVHLLANDELIDGGDFNTIPSRSIEPDSCVFHEDDSGRILHIGANHVRVLRVIDRRDAADSVFSVLTDDPANKVGVGQKRIVSNYQLKEQFVITAQRVMPMKPDIIFTQSGRRVHSRRNSEVDIDLSYEAVQGVTYEDDLDLLIVTLIKQRSDEEGYSGHVQLHDNQSGVLVKSIDLVEPWDTTCEHVITVDLDTLLHVTRQQGRKHHCYIYRLDRTLGDMINRTCVRKERKAVCSIRSRRQSRRRQYSNDDDLVDS